MKNNNIYWVLPIVVIFLLFSNLGNSFKKESTNKEPTLAECNSERADDISQNYKCVGDCNKITSSISNCIASYGYDSWVGDENQYVFITDDDKTCKESMEYSLSSGREKYVGIYKCTDWASYVNLDNVEYNVKSFDDKISVIDGNKIKGTMTVENQGYKTLPTTLIEMQIRDEKKSYSLSAQKTCEGNRDRYVTLTDLKWKESASISITSDPLPQGTYHVYFVSVDKCCNTGSCSPTPPFYDRDGAGGWEWYAGSITITSGTSTSDVTAIKNVVTRNIDNSITADIELKNDGAKIDQLIVEIQPISTTKKAASISSQMVCDESHPENVHKVISNFLNGQTASFTLKIPPQPEDTYEIMAVSVDKCCPSGGCSSMPPFNWGKSLGYVSIGSSGCPNDEQQCDDGTCKADCESDNTNPLTEQYFGFPLWQLLAGGFGLLLLLNLMKKK